MTKQLLQQALDLLSEVSTLSANSRYDNLPDGLLTRIDKLRALAQQEKPSQEPVWEDGIEPLASGGLVKLGKVDYAIRAALYTHPAPTQPALSESQLNVIFNMTAGYGRDDYISFARAIEAHCRGGVNHE